jgi:hypothetical protein
MTNKDKCRAEIISNAMKEMVHTDFEKLSDIVGKLSSYEDARKKLNGKDIEGIEGFDFRFGCFYGTILNEKGKSFLVPDLDVIDEEGKAIGFLNFENKPYLHIF